VYLAFAGGDRTFLVSLRAKMWPTRMGRGFAADVRIEEQRVSRRHAIITTHRGAVRVEDDQSANGTSVNGRRVIAAELSHGDELVLGRPGCATSPSADRRAA
jgi:pSer/pThr/pTyr-binding forkhead associated (FHA) protein